MLGNALQEMIAEMLGKQPCTFLLLHDLTILEGGASLHDQDLNDNARLTLVALEEPLKHNGIHRCDGCDFQRFCHYGYSWYGGEPTPVIALCEQCGGRRDRAVEGDYED